MLKEKNKILAIGTILNAMNVIFGLMIIIYLFLGFVDSDFSKIPNVTVTEEMVEIACLKIWLDVTVSITSIFLILSGIFSTIGFVKKNKDFILISIVLLIISLILDVVLQFCFPPFLTVTILISIILIIIGYIKQQKETT